MPRGGKRPGSGAPKGNLNAMRSGRHSQRLKQLALALARIPETQRLPIQLTYAHRRQERRARLIALRVLLELAAKNNHIASFLRARLADSGNRDGKTSQSKTVSAPQNQPNSFHKGHNDEHTSA
ncbi:MAG: hypothetical protein HYX97_04325 [Chloroflexi bacterium]|nr:hypothetical protein [Chloroflexota bacterium]